MPDPPTPAASPPPDPPRERRSDAVAPLTGLARWVFRASVAVFLLAVALMLADALFGVRLPQPGRGALPYVFAGGVALALTLYVSAYGAPKRPEKTGEPGRSRAEE
jgi:hypothetical protein